MQSVRSSSFYHLLPGQTAPLRVPQAASVLVNGPGVWLTREGDPKDHWLRAGELLRVNAKDQLWLSNEAHEVAVVELRTEASRSAQHR